MRYMSATHLRYAKNYLLDLRTKRVDVILGYDLDDDCSQLHICGVVNIIDIGIGEIDER